MATIKDGGQTESLTGGKIKEIKFETDHEGKTTTLSMWLKSAPKNGSKLDDESLSYLSIEEAIELSKELNDAIKTAIDNYVK